MQLASVRQSLNLRHKMLQDPRTGPKALDELLSGRPIVHAPPPTWRPVGRMSPSTGPRRQSRSILSTWLSAALSSEPRTGGRTGFEARMCVDDTARLVARRFKG